MAADPSSSLWRCRVAKRQSLEKINKVQRAYYYNNRGYMEKYKEARFKHYRNVYKSYCRDVPPFHQT